MTINDLLMAAAGKGGWSLTQDSGANAAQTLTKAAVAGYQHFITSLELVVLAAAVGAADINVVINDGAGNPVWKTGIATTAARGTRLAPVFQSPIPATPGNLINCVVDALGAGSVSRLSIIGFSVAV